MLKNRWPKLPCRNAYVTTCHGQKPLPIGQSANAEIRPRPSRLAEEEDRHVGEQERLRDGGKRRHAGLSSSAVTASLAAW